jgi:hypothetical protein
MRSLITLIARRAIGVSANLRKFTGVGFGTAERSADTPARPLAPGNKDAGKPAIVNGARFDPVPAVRRVVRAPTPAKTRAIELADKPSKFVDRAHSFVARCF